MGLPQDPLSWAVRTFKDDGMQSRYRNYRGYYHGDQDLGFATPKFLSAFGPLLAPLTYNRCGSVVDAMADRLHIVNFEAENGNGDAQAVMDLWHVNRMDKREGEVNVESLTEGDAYVIVWPNQDSGVPTIWPQDADQMRVLYDDEQPGLLILAAKLWKQSDEYLRLNLYLPDRLEKYISRTKVKSGLPTNSTSFEQYQPDGDQGWPLRYDWYRDGLPNIPVFHFANNGRTGEYGRSELADVIPMQDALNKAMADAMVISERMGFPQWWITGWKPQATNDDGSAQRPLNVGVDNLMSFAEPDVQLGQFMPANLTDLIAFFESFDMAIARVSRVPVHYLGLTSNFPSGESLKTAEAPFVKKIMDRQTERGNTWEDAMSLAMRQQHIDLAFQLNAVYESAEPRSEAEMAQNAVAMHTAGLPLPSILRMAFRLTDDEVQAVLAESDAQVERARALFNSGELGNPDFTANQQDQGAVA